MGYGNPDHISRTWFVTRQQALLIANMAGSLNVNHSHFVRYLLGYALSQIAAEKLVLRTKPSRYTLIDDEYQ